MSGGEFLAMTGSGSVALYYWTGIYHEIASAAAALALALTLNGYDIKKNLRKFIIIILIVGSASEVFFYFPQVLRIISLVIMYLVVIRWYFGFTFEKTFIVAFTLHFIFIIGKLTFTLIFVFAFGIPVDHFFDYPLFSFLFTLSYNIPFAALTYISHKRHWHIFQENRQIEMPFKLALPLFIQAILLTIISTELLFSYSTPSTMIIEPVISFTLVISTVLSFFFIWRILRAAEQEAAAAAQENLAEEMRRQIDAARAQRHDFINHVQIMTALLKDGQKEELARYAGALKREL